MNIYIYIVVQLVDGLLPQIWILSSVEYTSINIVSAIKTGRGAVNGAGLNRSDVKRQT